MLEAAQYDAAHEVLKEGLVKCEEVCFLAPSLRLPPTKPTSPSGAVQTTGTVDLCFAKVASTPPDAILCLSVGAEDGEKEEKNYDSASHPRAAGDSDLSPGAPRPSPPLPGKGPLSLSGALSRSLARSLSLFCRNPAAWPRGSLTNYELNKKCAYPRTGNR